MRENSLQQQQKRSKRGRQRIQVQGRQGQQAEWGIQTGKTVKGKTDTICMGGNRCTTSGSNETRVSEGRCRELNNYTEKTQRRHRRHGTQERQNMVLQLYYRGRITWCVQLRMSAILPEVANMRRQQKKCCHKITYFRKVICTHVVCLQTICALTRTACSGCALVFHATLRVFWR